MKRNICKLLALLVVLALITACGGGQPSPEPAPTPSPEQEPVAEADAPKGTIILSTTTSPQDSGLLDYILPVFTEETGWEVDVIAVGTGAAIQMGRDGDADVLLVHSRPDEDKFVADGFADARYDVMYNDFLIVGPADGSIAYNEDVQRTFTDIQDNQLIFVSRGDDSGTHKKELSIWKALGADPEKNPEYVSAGQGMGATLSMAAEMEGYTLSDRATWLAFPDKGNLVIVCEKSENLLNPYGVIPVSKSVNEKITTEGGQAFADWIVSPKTQELIKTFGVDKYGEPLFIPDAK